MSNLVDIWDTIQRKTDSQNKERKQKNEKEGRQQARTTASSAWAEGTASHFLADDSRCSIFCNFCYGKYACSTDWVSKRQETDCSGSKINLSNPISGVCVFRKTRPSARDVRTTRSGVSTQFANHRRHMTFATFGDSIYFFAFDRDEHTVCEIMPT